MMSRPRKQRSSRRGLHARGVALAGAAAVLLAACGAEASEPAAGTATGALVSVPTTPVTASPTVPAPSTTLPLEPWEVITAVASPSLTVLDTYDAPDHKHIG